MSVSVKTSHLAPARFSKISFGLTETHPWRILIYFLSNTREVHISVIDTINIIVQYPVLCNIIDGVYAILKVCTIY